MLGRVMADHIRISHEWRGPDPGKFSKDPSPIIFASPHSGRLYPDDMRRLSPLPLNILRRSEDFMVDRLVEDVASCGAPLLCAVSARAYVDLNRADDELDPLLFDPRPPAHTHTNDERVAAGLGVIPRMVSSNTPIYAKRLPLAEAQRRLDGVYKPYHRALAGALDSARERHGWCLLVDCHSMPAAAQTSMHSRADIVLGDRYGTSCTSTFSDFLERQFRRRGLSVVRNAPYAGGYCTCHYGQPSSGVHSIQVELRRDLYMDERRLTPHAGMPRVKAILAAVFRALCNEFARPQHPLAAE